MTKDEAIKIVWNLTEIINDYDLTDEIEEAIHMAAEALETKETGRWIEEGIVDSNDNVYCSCSNCGHGDTHAKCVTVPYCWFCGAKMKEEN